MTSSEEGPQLLSNPPSAFNDEEDRLTPLIIDEGRGPDCCSSPTNGEQPPNSLVSGEERCATPTPLMIDENPDSITTLPRVEPSPTLNSSVDRDATPPLIIDEGRDPCSTPSSKTVNDDSTVASFSDPPIVQRRLAISFNDAGVASLSFTGDSPKNFTLGGLFSNDSFPSAKEGFDLSPEKKADYMKPFLDGWRRLVVMRNNTTHGSADAYYFAPDGTKLRSKLDIARYMVEKNMVTDYTADRNFAFVRRLLGSEFAQFEEIRQSAFRVRNADGTMEWNGKLKCSSPSSNNFGTSSLRTYKNTAKRHLEPICILQVPEDPPIKKRKKRPRYKKNRRYCICSGKYQREMASCDNPKCVLGWYHYDCVKLIEKPEGVWYCPICRGPNPQTLFEGYAALQNPVPTT